jgi:iron(III) transport system substrate-binding protein
MQVRAMRKPTHSRRDVLKASAAMAASAVFAEPLKAATAEPSAVTPALIEAARKEGKISFYTALELPTSERLAKAFEAKYPGIAVCVERSSAERIFQRIGREQASRIYAVGLTHPTIDRFLNRFWHWTFWKISDLNFCVFRFSDFDVAWRPT